MTRATVDLLIQGGTIVTDSWTGAATIVVDDGRVTAILAPDSGDLPAADHSIDATGRLIMPGGVDPHCHIAVPLGEFVTLDGFESASLAALAGGTTTIVDFAIPTPEEHPLTALRAKLELGRVGSRCDFALHGCITKNAEDVGDIIQAFAASGVRTVKLFTTYRDLLMVEIDTIEKVMAALNEVSGLTYVHAEANDLVESAQDQAVREGHIGAADMASTRPQAAEERAVGDVLAAATRMGSPVYFVHQSTPEAVDLVVSARQRGVFAYSESCPHYLTLNSDRYAGEQPEQFVCCPPLRERATVDRLGQRLVLGFLDTVGSDHCCYDSGQKLLRSDDVRAMPNGLPGVETRLPVIWDEFVRSGRISPQQFVNLVAANPARLNGIYPRKGTIAPGSDADLVIFDTEATRAVRAVDLHMETDYTPYEGRIVTGWPTTVLSRGRVVLDEGRLVDPGPVGEFLPAGPVLLH